jgi:MFS family permease
MFGLYYGWWVVMGAFAVAVYMSGTLFFGFTAFLEPIVKEFGWGYAEVSLVVSLRGLEMGVFAPVAGFLADRHGSRRLVLFGSLTVGLGLILLSTAHSLLMFYGSFFLIAFGAGGCTSVVLMTAVARWFEKDIGKALGLMACGYGAGGAMIPLVVWLIDAYHWRTALVLAGLGMWSLGIPLSFVFRDPAGDGGHDRHRGVAGEAGTINGSDGGERELPFVSSFRDRDFWYLNVAEALRMMALTGVVTHVMPYLSSLGMSRGKAGLVAAALPVVSIAGRFGFGWLSDVLDKRSVMMIAYGFMAAGLLAFTQGHGEPFLVSFLLLFSPGFGGCMIVRGAMLREYFGLGSFGRLLGITMGTASLGGILGPPLAGWAFDLWRSFQPIWFAFAGLLGGGIVILWKIRPRRVAPS